MSIMDGMPVTPELDLIPAGVGNGMPEPDMMERGDPIVDEARLKLVTKIIERVKNDKAFFRKRFNMVKEDLRFVSGIQWPGATDIRNGGRYTANVVQRHVAGKVASLYAKNPKFIAKRRKRLEFAIWDGNKASLDAAQQGMAMAGANPGMPVDPNLLTLIQDIAKGMEAKAMATKIAKTLELVNAHFLDTQPIAFKRSMKALVRRVVSAGYGYVKLDFHRENKKTPDTQAQISDITTRLATIKRLQADMHDGEIQPDHSEAAELELALAALQAEPDVLVSEGINYLFPSPTSIIPDSRCKQLAGFVGCDWVTEEFLLTPDEVKEIYGIDLGKSFTPYTDDGKGMATRGSTPSSANKTDDGRQDKCMVWVNSNVKSGLVYTVCDGYKNFLEEPRAPNVKLERFWQIFPITFNDLEPDETGDCSNGVFPPSDVRLLMSVQMEYNRSRNGLREHRKANRPKTASGGGQLSPEDKKKLESHPANAHIELQGLQPGQKVDDLLQAVKGAPIDPALYDATFLMEDMMRVGGSQEANLGGTSGATATEASIGEGSRVSAVSSNADDLDDLLSELARAAGQTLLMELSAERVTEIAGPGAVWPQMTRQEAADEIILEIVAGSSGRPNKDKDAAILERLTPVMLQIPGISPDWLLKQFVAILDDRFDPEEALLSGIPSITALNAIASAATQAVQAGGATTPNGGGAAATGDPAADPAQQGAAGANNAPTASPPGGAPQASGGQPNTDGRLGGAMPMPG